jgi:hypothetical protein
LHNVTAGAGAAALFLMRNNMKQKKLDHLDLVCLEIAKYNKIHNTYYSYGEYTALVRAGKIISDVVSEKRCKKNENKKVL